MKLITRSIPMDPKCSVVKGLHCIFSWINGTPTILFFIFGSNYHDNRDFNSVIEFIYFVSRDSLSVNLVILIYFVCLLYRFQGLNNLNIFPREVKSGTDMS